MSSKLWCTMAAIMAAVIPSIVAGDSGYFNAINLISSEKPTFVSVNGHQAMPDGLKTGEQTGPLGLPEGDYNLMFTNEEAEEPLVTKITLEKKSSPVIMVYLEETVDEKTQEVKKTIKARKAPSMASSRVYTLGLLSVVNEPLDVKVNGETLMLKKFDNVRSNWKGPMLKILVEEKPSVDMKFEVAGSYLAVFYRLNSGSIGCSVVRDVTYAISPVEPLDQEKSESGT